MAAVTARTQVMRRSGPLSGALSTLPLPPHEGLRIGLFGGSFNPPHEGHLAVAETALKRLRLDAVWWLVAVRNPLKNPTDVAALEARLERTRRLAAHPRFHVLPLEAWTGTLYTVDLLARLAPVLARGRFVWIMGTDSFATLHRWKDWQAFMCMLPVVVLSRPGSVLAALNGHAARAFRRHRLPARLADRLPFLAPPAWCHLEMPRHAISSTCLRHPEACERGFRFRLQPAGTLRHNSSDPAIHTLEQGNGSSNR